MLPSSSQNSLSFVMPDMFVVGRGQDPRTTTGRGSKWATKTGSQLQIGQRAPGSTRHIQLPRELKPTPSTWTHAHLRPSSSADPPKEPTSTACPNPSVGHAGCEPGTSEQARSRAQCLARLWGKARLNCSCKCQTTIGQDKRRGISGPYRRNLRHMPCQSQTGCKQSIYSPETCS